MSHLMNLSKAKSQSVAILVNSFVPISPAWKNHLPSGNLPNSYWTWHSFDVDLPIKDGDCLVRKRLVYQRVHHPKKEKANGKQTNRVQKEDHES